MNSNKNRGGESTHPPSFQHTVNNLLEPIGRGD